MATCPVCKTKGPERGVLCPNGCAYLVKDSALKVKAGGLERYLGKVIGSRYAVVGYLGRGGMGVVYRARDLRGSGEVALKVLLSASPSARARRRFLREAKVAARLRHPNVVVTYRFGRADGGFFLAMELIEGQPLSRFARQGLPFDVLLEVCVQVLSALSAAHEAGVIHRDLKPANILLSHTQHGLQVKVLDFGLARFAVYEDELTRTGELVGTPRYMSPEQARGSRDIGPETDLYALGVILYEFVTGKLLFEAETPTALAVMHITEPVPKPEPRPNLAMPPGFEAVMRKLLSKDPKARYNSAAAVRAAMTPFLRNKRVKQQAADALPDLSIDDRYAEESVSRSSMPVLTSEIPAVQWPRPGAIRYETSFVGREVVFEQLWGQAQGMIETGRGAVVYVEGETGVGKSRLMEELRARCFEGLSLDWFVGESREGAGQGLWSLRQVLSALIGLRSEGHADARRIIQGQLARWGTPTEDEINRLTDLLRPRESDAVVLVDSEEEQGGREDVDRELMFGLVERVLRRASAVRPTVFLLEDLHWAGVPTQQFLEYLIPSLHTTPAPLVIITTISADREGSALWGDFPQRMRRYGPDTFQTLELRRLDPDSSRRMIEEMLSASERLVDKIFELSEGNPLHIIQVARYLREQGLIQEKSGVWNIAAGNERLVGAVPPELADLLQARVRALAERHELGSLLTRVLDRCALIGRQVHYELLVDMIRREEAETGARDGSLIPRLDEALDVFIEEGVLDEGEMVEHEDSLEFTHALLREVLNNNLRGRRATRAAHRAAAQAKESFFAGHLDNHAFQIAEHYESSRDWSKALPWFVRAAAKARSAWDLQTSLKLYAKAEAMVERLTRVDIDLHRQMLEAQGEIYSAQGRYLEAAERFNRAFEVAEVGGAPEVMAHLIFLRGDAARMLNDFESAEGCYREALAVSRAVGDRSGIGRALLGLAKIFRIRHQLLKAHQFLTAAEDQFKASNELRFLAACSRQRAYVFMRAGRWKETRAHLMIALGLFRQVEDTHARACIQRDLARLSLLEGRIREAQLQSRKALDSFEGLGDRYGYAKTLSCLGEVYYALKQYQAAKDLYNRALGIFETLESTEDMIIEMFHLGMVAFKRDDIDQAHEWFVKAQHQASSNEQRTLRGIALAGQAWLAAHEDDIQAARTFMSRALPGLSREAFPIRDLAEIYEDCAECFHRHRDTILAEACRRWARDIRGGEHELSPGR